MMSKAPCCHAPAAPRTLARHCTRAAGWVVPSLILAVMPKCPVCFAAYIAMATGVGLSVSAAAYVRTGLIVLSVGLLCLAALHLARHWALLRRPPATTPSTPWRNTP